MKKRPMSQLANRIRAHRSRAAFDRAMASVDPSMHQDLRAAAARDHLVH